MDLIKIRRELNQLIINALEAFIRFDYNHVDDYAPQRVCSNRGLPMHINTVLQHYYRPSDVPRVICNKCVYFDDYEEDQAAFITG